MGKAKKKKFYAQKPRPTGLPSVGECEAEIELEERVDTTSATIQNIIEKLQSPNEENRESACTTIAGLVSQPGTVPALMKLNVVKILGPLVLDHNWDIRHRALGALRNLSIDGGTSACEEMVAKDILTPVLALIQQFGSGDQFSETDSQRRKVMICETYSHAFYLLQNLCENSDQAVTTVSNGSLVPIVCAIMNSDRSTEDLKLSVLDFLHTVTEDNSALCRPQLVECVQQIMALSDASSVDILLKTLATGVLVNLEGSHLSTARGDLVLPIVRNMSTVLSVDVTALLVPENGIPVTEPDSENSQGTSASQETASETQKLKEKIVMDVKHLLKAQQVALEVITNLCCTDDTEWEDLDDSESSSDDASEVPMEEEQPQDPCAASLCVSTELHSAYVSCGIVEKVLNAAQPLTAEQLQNLQNYTNIAKSFQSKQTHALLCLNNLVSSLNTEALGGPQKLYSVWQGLTQLSTATDSLENQGLLDAVTSAMRAVIEKLAEADPDKFQEVQATDLQFIYEMCTKCQWPEVRVNSLRVVATFGAILAKNAQPHHLLKDIGALFMEVVCSDSDLWVIAEALDSIFDVFGEDHVNPVLKEIGMIDRLKTIAPHLKTRVQQNRKALGEHYPVISTARTNLVRFIKYKQTHMK